MDVRAAVAIQAGKPLEVMTVQLEGPRAGEVLIEVKATGICHTDDFTLSGADPEGLFPELAPGSIVKPEGVKRFRGKDKTIMKRQLIAARALKDCAAWLGVEHIAMEVATEQESDATP